jgi:hypothetical protein
MLWRANLVFKNIQNAHNAIMNIATTMVIIAAGQRIEAEVALHDV